jgi:hypothetical protein
MGRVLQSRIQEGEYAPAGALQTPLMLFGSVHQLNVRVDIDEQEGWKMRSDAAAYATTRGNTAERTPLKFVRFEPYVTLKKSLTGDSTERVDTRMLQAIYTIPGTEPAIHVGQQMERLY